MFSSSAVTTQFTNKKHPQTVAIEIQTSTTLSTSTASTLFVSLSIEENFQQQNCKSKSLFCWWAVSGLNKFQFSLLQALLNLQTKNILNCCNSISDKYYALFKSNFHNIWNITRTVKMSTAQQTSQSTSEAYKTFSKNIRNKNHLYNGEQFHSQLHSGFPFFCSHSSFYKPKFIFK